MVCTMYFRMYGVLRFMYELKNSCTYSKMTIIISYGTWTWLFVFGVERVRRYER